MENVLKKLCLPVYRVRIVEEKILTNIVCYLSIEDFLKLGFSDRNAVMSLRIECLTNTSVITKVLVKIDDVFSVKQMSNILRVSERTVLRRMVEYGLKIRNFFNIYDDQLDSDVLALTKDYSFYGETDLRGFFEREVNNHSTLPI